MSPTVTVVGPYRLFFYVNELGEPPHVMAADVDVTDHELVVGLVDGRRIAVPLAWFPRLLHASAEQRAVFELIGDGEGIHWPGVDEDVSVRGLVLGYPSAEVRKLA